MAKESIIGGVSVWLSSREPTTMAHFDSATDQSSVGYYQFAYRNPNLR